MTEISGHVTLEQGFLIICLAPYHCIFHAIELIWTLVKGKVAELNQTFKIHDVQTLKIDALEAVTSAQWSKACRHYEELVEKFSQSDVSCRHRTSQMTDW